MTTDAHHDTHHDAHHEDQAAPAPAPVRPHRRVARRTWAVVLAVGLATTGTVAVATTTGSGSSAATPGTTAAQVPAQRTPSWHGYGWPGEGTGGGSTDGTGGVTDGGSTAGSGAATATTAATGTQEAGVVTILSTLGYEGAESAGTGMVLTSGGEVLTNNHVVSGATSISVTVESTGRTYTAQVVGTDAPDDVAVLQLVGASGLQTVALDQDGVSTGEAVTAVGNAGGTGDLVAAPGTVTATGQSITTQSEGSAAGESLTGLIQVDADIVSGDSGGPLLDAQGEVVGIDTAASSGSAAVTGFAIPITTALAVVQQVERGVETGGVTLGLPAFLGVELSSLSGATGAGALLAGVVDGTPAARAGLVAGDTVTAVDGTRVASADDLDTVLAGHDPGDRVGLTWTDAAGAAHSATVTLAQGPAA
jgi:S1-C subfamily serine protease